MIPQRAFCFWANRTMSWLRYMTLYSFTKLNPDWELELYLSFEDTDGDEKYWVNHNSQDFFSFTGEDYFDRAMELPGLVVKEFHLDHKKITTHIGQSHRSNFFKWEQLAEVGGIYFDMDILWVRPINTFWGSLRGFTDAMCWHGMFSIGLMASQGESPFFRKMLNRTYKRFSSEIYQSAGVNVIYDMLGNNNNRIWDRLMYMFPSCHFKNIPQNVVYPHSFDDHKVYFLDLDKKLPRDCIGIHWYAGHAMSQVANNLLTDRNFRGNGCTITHFAEKVIDGLPIGN